LVASRLTGFDPKRPPRVRDDQDGHQISEVSVHKLRTTCPDFADFTRVLVYDGFRINDSLFNERKSDDRLLCEQPINAALEGEQPDLSRPV
jgi:hypothetical protein